MLLWEKKPWFYACSQLLPSEHLRSNAYVHKPRHQEQVATNCMGVGAGVDNHYIELYELLLDDN